MVELITRCLGCGTVTPLDSAGWRLQIPPGPAGKYRLAQLDDTTYCRRSEFLWQAPCCLELDARVSGMNLAGTWGFGFWNDPFSVGLGVGGTARRLPVLPNAAWFFFASEPNYLAFQDTHPAQGMLMATFSSSTPAAWMALPGLAAAPMLAWPATARLLRRAARRVLAEDAARLNVDLSVRRHYAVEVGAHTVQFSVDGERVFQSGVAPAGRMGLVLWIDNQYAAFPPDGKLRAGTLPTPEEAWLEISHVQVL